VPVDLPVDPGLAHVLARALGDRSEPGPGLTPHGDVLHAPLTYTRVVAEHFDTDGELRTVVPGEPVPEGGSPDRLHAEQHFTYHRDLRAGERLRAVSRPGDLWQRRGRTGLLEFAEVITDFVAENGTVVVTARRVGVRKLGADA
jgi:hypothetical protein